MMMMMRTVYQYIGGPKGWESCWWDISTGVPAEEKHLLLGGKALYHTRLAYTVACSMLHANAAAVRAHVDRNFASDEAGQQVAE
jgi:hypothetical protein